MTATKVTTKGIDWLVYPDGRIAIPGYTSTEISRVRNGIEYRYFSKYPEKTLATCAGRHGYLEVAPMINGKRTKELVHRLIGLAFVQGYEQGLTINHINGVKTDNRPENLEWVSLARNSKHQWEIGLVDLRGEKHPSAKLTSKRVIAIRDVVRNGIPMHTVALIAGVSPSLINHIMEGRRWASV